MAITIYDTFSSMICRISEISGERDVEFAKFQKNLRTSIAFLQDTHFLKSIAKNVCLLECCGTKAPNEMDRRLEKLRDLKEYKKGRQWTVELSTDAERKTVPSFSRYRYCFCFLVYSLVHSLVCSKFGAIFVRNR